MSEWILLATGLFLVGFFLGARPGQGTGAASPSLGNARRACEHIDPGR
jgi:hypothetical protein